MTVKPLTFHRLSILLATGALSTGLLLSGCSNNDNVETADSGTENTATAVENSDTDAVNQAESVDDNTIKSDQIADNAEEETVITSDNINPATSSTKQKSLVTNPTESGTPEDTVKKAIDSLYYGDAKKSASYYQVDMANFEEELANTQAAFQQTVDSITMTKTTYNDDKTRVTIEGEIMLKGQDKPAPLAYNLQKINGQWKILG